jgi:hypothetical protein
VPLNVTLGAVVRSLPEILIRAPAHWS